MDWLPDWRSLNFGRRPPAIRFKDAVPRRSDRRELRRLFRKASRLESAERDRYLDKTLGQLIEQHVPIASIRHDPDSGDDILLFFDGTRLALDLPGDINPTDPARLRPGARLGQATPCLGNRWYRLWFLLPYERQGAEVVAKVATYNPTEGPTQLINSDLPQPRKNDASNISRPY